jgi:hypothetical protein
MHALITIPLSVLILLLQPTTTPSELPDPDQLARNVMKAHGADAWPKVTRIRFTFNVEREGKVSSVKHDWDVKAGTDTVTIGDKTTTVDITHANHEGDVMRAYARFINDTYWLLAPLKVMDGGVTRTTGPPEEIDGITYQRLHLSFENVGLTPTDQYDLWVNPQTRLVEYWDYIPAKGTPMRSTRREIRDFSGLKLSTKFVTPRATITMTDVEVE